MREPLSIVTFNKLNGNYTINSLHVHGRPILHFVVLSLRGCE